MGLRADHLTLARMLLLPLPVALLHGGSPAWSLAAFTLLGLTDLVDGPLARHHGSSPFGPLLDNLADRVFLAVVYCALAEFGIVPLLLFKAMLAREFLVVALRGLFRQDLRAWRGGQLKTTVQMFGAGFLLLLYASPDGPWFTLAAAVALAASAALGVVIGARARRLDWRAAWGVGLSAGLLAARLSGGVSMARDVALFVIAGVTLVSAARLLVRFRTEILAAMRGRPAHAIHVLAVSCLVPLLWAPQLSRGPLAAMIATGIVASELAILVLGNTLNERGHAVRMGPGVLRLLVLGIAGLATGTAGRDSSAGLAIAFAALALLGTLLFVRGRAVARVLSVQAPPSAGRARLEPAR